MCWSDNLYNLDSKLPELTMSIIYQAPTIITDPQMKAIIWPSAQFRKYKAQAQRLCLAPNHTTTEGRT